MTLHGLGGAQRRQDPRPGTWLLRLLQRRVVDPLTGLPGRHELVRRGQRVLRAAEHDARPCALLLVDLDSFKYLNDSAGHHVGDRVLEEVAHRLRAALPDRDLLVRLGGDEFAILTAPLDRIEDADLRAEAVVEAVARPLPVDDLDITVGASVGLALFPADGVVVEELMLAADQAMYAAKKSGTGQWRTSGSERTWDPSRPVRLLADLRRPGALDQLRVHYQPQVSAHDGRIRGFEALVRWEHPELGMLPARQFVPLAERSGLMASVTVTVLEHALRDSASLQDLAPGSPLALNVTRRLILGHRVLDELRDRLEAHQVRPEHLILEINEPLGRSNSVTEPIYEMLSDVGLGVSIRGFGRGRSSLTGLWQNPAVREVKLDASLVRTATDDPESARLMRGLVDGAHGLGLRVVAEGLEDAPTVDLVRTLGCDLLQGFWVCPPVPLDRLAAWDDEWRRDGQHLLS